MSIYEWPDVGDPGRERGDDPFGRRAFVQHGRRPLAHEQALAAGRTLPRPARRRSSRRAAPPLAAPAQDLTNLWLPLGPTVILSGQATNRPRVSGRVRALAVSDDGQRVYAGAANGGVWYSEDAGASWSSIGGLAATNVAGVARPAHRNASGAVLVRFDPNGHKANDLVIVGTGEETPAAQARPDDSLGGVGILTATGPAASAADDPWTIEAPNLAGRGVYRLAIQPGAATVVAATSIGLFERPAAPGAGVEWAKVSAAPFDTLDDACVDVLWTAAGGGFPARLWVWVVGGGSKGLWVRPDGGDHFTQVATPGAYDRVSALAASQPAAKVYVLNNRYRYSDTPKKLPALYQIDASGNASPQAAVPVAGIPDVLTDQGDYDIAVAVDPGNANRVAIAGSLTHGTSPSGLAFPDWNAAITVGEVGLVGGNLTFGTPNPPTMVGVGAHPDVHDVKYSSGGARLWMACDGGVFRSDNPTSQVGFVACNDGLSIAEANFLAPHPTCEGYVVVGLQDNGTIERLSTNAWRVVREGDGGGVAFDPSSTNRYLFQYVYSAWHDSDGGTGFEQMLTRKPTPRNLLSDGAKKEDDSSAFYSQPGAIAHSRPAGTVGQIALGTDRIWYTEDFGTSWVTLPSGTDPIAAAAYNRDQDRLGEAVYACRFASPDVLWVLTGQRYQQPGGQVFRLERAAGSADARGPGTWTKPALRILAQSAKNKKDTTGGDGSVRQAVAWTDLAVNLELEGVQRGAKGAVYLGTAGHPTNTDVDTLYWFDGDSTWHATGLRSTVPAPVTAVVCDPANPNRVYIGTTVGVWRGLRILSDGQPPTWTWEALVNGLPEAAVEDLALFDSDGVRLLRAAIAARGVWELQLEPALVELCYVRAHDDDQRRRPRALETKRDGSSPRSWHGSPDVRPRPAPGPIPKPTTLAWTMTDPNVDTEVLRRFQAALRSQTNDARSRATGQWDFYFEEVLRARGATQTGAHNMCNLDGNLWDTVMVAPHVSAEPWGAAIPSEADLYELVAELHEGEPGAASCSMPPAQLKVDVVVHRRSLAQLDGGDVRVTLLQWIDPSAAHRARFDDPTTWFSGNVPWTGAVNDVLNSAGGSTSATFGAGWAFVGPAASRRKTLAGQTLDPLHSGVVSFDIDLRGARQNLLVLLVAVIRQGSDIALAPASLQDLALTNPGVAVRSVRVNPH